MKRKSHEPERLDGARVAVCHGRRAPLGVGRNGLGHLSDFLAPDAPATFRPVRGEQVAREEATAMGNARRRPKKARYLGPLLLVSAALASSCSETPSKPASPSGDCAPASQGCACADGAVCDTGLACSAGVCVGTASVGFAVDPRARGCEILLSASSTRVLSVDFSRHVRGAFVREAPRTAVSFIASEDAPIPDGSVRVHYEDDGNGAPAISRVNCIDVQGAPIEGAEVKSHG